MISFCFPVLLLVDIIKTILITILTNQKTVSIWVYASSLIPSAYGYNSVLTLPLPALAGNAVPVWYSNGIGVSYDEGINLLPRCP
jgi:hypothetical protein